MIQIIVTLLIVSTLVTSFIIIWKLNHSTPIPDGAFENQPSCQGCSNKSCGNYEDDKN